MDSFEGKAAVVTGGGSGIGRGICLALAEAGARVAVADIDGDRAAQVASEVETMGARGLALPTDVTQAASVEALKDCISNVMVGEVRGKIEFTPLEAIWTNRKKVDINLYKLAEILSI